MDLGGNCPNCGRPTNGGGGCPLLIMGFSAMVALAGIAVYAVRLVV